MQSFSFINQKGGVGKTMSALNVGAALARGGKRTLLIDMDSQVNLSSTFGKQDLDGNIYDFLIEDASPTVEKVGDELYLLPGSKRMSLYDKNILDKNRMQPSLQLKQRLNEFDLAKSFDYIIFDSPPKLDYITLSVLSFVNWVFVPVMSDQYSIDGAIETIKIVNSVNKVINPDLVFGGLFMVRFDPRAILYRSYKDQLMEAYNSLVMEYYTRENVSLRESIAKGMDVFSYAPDSNGAKDYFALTNELLFIMREDKITHGSLMENQPLNL